MDCETGMSCLLVMEIVVKVQAGAVTWAVACLSKGQVLLGPAAGRA